MSACTICDKCPCYEHERKTVAVSESKAPPTVTIDGDEWTPALVRLIAGEHAFRALKPEHFAAILAALPDETAAELLAPLVAGFKRHLSDHYRDRYMHVTGELAAEREARRVENAAWVQWADAVDALAVPASQSWLKRPDRREPVPPPPQVCKTCGGKGQLRGEEPGRGIVYWPCPDCGQAPRPEET